MKTTKLSPFNVRKISLNNVFACVTLKKILFYSEALFMHNTLFAVKATIFYLLFINLIGFAIMGIDKHKAKKHRYRISEKTLFLTAVLGGSIGTLAGMYTFHHKTKHWYFVVGMPAILIMQLGLIWKIYFA